MWNVFSMNPESTCSPKGPWSWKSYSKHAWPWPNHLQEPPLEADNWCHTWSPLGTNPRIGWCAWFWWWQRLHSHPLAPHLLRWNWKSMSMAILQTWPFGDAETWPFKGEVTSTRNPRLKNDALSVEGKWWPLLDPPGVSSVTQRFFGKSLKRSRDCELAGFFHGFS